MRLSRFYLRRKLRVGACTHVNATTLDELQAAFAAAWHTRIRPACRESTNQNTGLIDGFLALGPRHVERTINILTLQAGIVRQELPDT
jgi:hypothetical protein